MTDFIIRQQEFSVSPIKPGLYIVATPIGNLGDITLRALEVLAACNVVACEDTRVTGKLLTRYGIKAHRRSYHEHNADREGVILLNKIEAGEAVALVSDAGTPLISDPGQRLVKGALSRNLPVTAIPGASAPLAALAISGMNSERFTFAGFLPNKQGARIAMLEAFTPSNGTLIFFEGPSRLCATLRDMSQVFGLDHRGCVARELTKLHEEARSGPLNELTSWYEEHPAKGEIVIVVDPIKSRQSFEIKPLLQDLLSHMSTSRAAAEAAKMTGSSKRQLYQMALELASEKKEQSE